MLKFSFSVLAALASVVFSDAALADCGGGSPGYTPQTFYHSPIVQHFVPSCPTTMPFAHPANRSISVGDIVNGERVVGVGPLIPTTRYEVVEQTSSSSVEGSLNQIQSDLRAIKSRLGI